ncbi:MAG: hypothetical protein NW201_08140 [Gemmatimonadales bacterium]|nr:hypothetical protein [Gemmatimonadales bacterium]
MTNRLTPWDLVFRELAPERFPGITQALERAAADAADRDRFLMLRPVVQLLHELRPAGGVGDAVDGLVALVHHAYLYWAEGRPTFRLSPDMLGRVLGGALPHGGEGHAPSAYYIEVPERQVWSQVVPEAPHEPLDGCFLSHRPDGALSVLGVFGVRPGRAGFSLAEAAGARPAALARGAELFEPVLPGGAEAGLSSIVGEEELLEFGWRAHLLAGATVA